MKNPRQIIQRPQIWAIMFICATLALAYLTLVSTPNIQIGPDVRNRTAHFFAYLIYSGVGVVWRKKVNPNLAKITIFTQTGITTAAYGAFLEWMQFYLPHREADLIDGICNITGAFIGSILILNFYHPAPAEVK